MRTQPLRPISGPIPSRLPPRGTAAGPAHRGHVPVRPTWAGSGCSARGGGGRRRWARRCCPPVAGGGSPGFGTAGCVLLKYCPAGLEKDNPTTQTRHEASSKFRVARLVCSAAAERMRDQGPNLGPLICKCALLGEQNSC